MHLSRDPQQTGWGRLPCVLGRISAGVLYEPLRFRAAPSAEFVDLRWRWHRPRVQHQVILSRHLPRSNRGAHPQQHPRAGSRFPIRSRGPLGEVERRPGSRYVPRQHVPKPRDPAVPRPLRFVGVTVVAGAPKHLRNERWRTKRGLQAQARDDRRVLGRAPECNCYRGACGENHQRYRNPAHSFHLPQCWPGLHRRSFPVR